MYVKGTQVDISWFDINGWNDIFSSDIKHIFLREKFWIFIQISSRFIPNGGVYNKSTSVRVMARQFGAKPLTEPMMTHFTDAYMRHRAKVLNGTGGIFTHIMKKSMHRYCNITCCVSIWIIIQIRNQMINIMIWFLQVMLSLLCSLKLVDVWFVGVKGHIP